VQISIIVVVITNLLIWRKVKNQGKAMERYSVVRQPAMSSSVVINHQTKGQVDNMERKAVQKSVDGRQSVLAAKAESIRATDTNFTVADNARMNKRRELDARARRERMVFYQCLLYSTAFIMCFIGPTIFHLAGWFWDNRKFWHIGVLSTFTPLQGVFNAVIYARPIYMRVRSKFPHLTRLQALYRVFFVADPFGVDGSVLTGSAAASYRKQGGSANSNSKNSSVTRIRGESIAGGAARQTDQTGAAEMSESFSLRQPEQPLEQDESAAEDDPGAAPVNNMDEEDYYDEMDDALSLGDDVSDYEGDE